jgi:hypothetical protein
VKSYTPGRLLLLIGLPLTTVCPVALWDGWTGYFLCPLALGLPCVVLGSVLLFLRALQSAAGSRSDDR